MDARSENSSVQVVRWAKLPGQVIQRTRLQVWFIRICSSILIWTCLVQLVAVGELWHPKFLTGILYGSETIPTPPPAPPPLPPPKNTTRQVAPLKVLCRRSYPRLRAILVLMVSAYVTLLAYFYTLTPQPYTNLVDSC